MYKFDLGQKVVFKYQNEPLKTGYIKQIKSDSVGQIRYTINDGGVNYWCNLLEKDIADYTEMILTTNPSGVNPFYKKYFEGVRNDSLDAYMYGINKMFFAGKAKPLALTPSKVFFNDKKKATTIMFGETATVVKCGKGDKYDRRIGFLEAYFQATCNMSKNKALKYLNEIVKDKE